jgi:translation initiation factor IF-1
MPNTQGGSKFKKYKKGNKATLHEEKLIECDDANGEAYGYVQDKFGNGRFKVDIVTEKGTVQKDCVAVLSGKMQKQKWKHFVDKGSLVLLTTLEDGNKEKEKYYIIHKYDPSDLRTLVKMKKVNIADYEKRPQDVNFRDDANGDDTEEEEEEEESKNEEEWVDFEKI